MPAVSDQPTRKCRYCGQPLPDAADIQVGTIPLRLGPTVCDACADRRRASAEAELKAGRTQAFHETHCPPAYHDTAADRIVAELGRRDLLDRVLAWRHGPRGLILHGDTGKCKTRCVWLLLRRLYVEDRILFVAMTSGEFARSCAEQYALSAECGRNWFQRLTSTPVLFIDDFGKEKLTERVEAELFDIIEHRTSHGKPLLLTTNHVGKTLVAKFSPDRGEPVVRRLREFCDAIHFNPKSHDK